jgi:hypothetical protein
MERAQGKMNLDTPPAKENVRPLAASIPKEWPDNFRKALSKEANLRGWDADAILDSFPNGLDRVADHERFESIFGDAIRKGGYRKTDSRFMNMADFAQKMLGVWNVPDMMNAIDGVIRTPPAARYERLPQQQASKGQVEDEQVQRSNEEVNGLLEQSSKGVVADPSDWDSVSKRISDGTVEDANARDQPAYQAANRRAGSIGVTVTPVRGLGDIRGMWEPDTRRIRLNSSQPDVEYLTDHELAHALVDDKDASAVALVNEASVTSPAFVAFVNEYETKQP